MPDEQDRELARLFADLRRADAAAMPPFHRVLHRGDGLRARSAAPRRALAVASLTAAALIAGILLTTVHRTYPAQPRAVSIAQWTSPTGFLLRTPGSELLEQPRAFLELSPADAGLERSSARHSSTPSPAFAGRKTRGDRP